MLVFRQKSAPVESAAPYPNAPRPQERSAGRPATAKAPAPEERGQVAKRYARLTRLVKATDLGAVVAAMGAAYLMRFGWSFEPTVLWTMALAPVVWLAVLSAARVYAIQHIGPWEEFRRLLGAVSAGVGAIALASYWLHAEVSRLWVVLTWVLSILFILSVRLGWHRLMGRMRADGRLAYRTVLIGVNEEASRLAKVMDAAPNLGFSVVALLHPDHHQGNGSQPGTNGIERLRDVIRETSADCVFVASTAVTVQDMSKITRTARLESVEVKVSANIADTLSTRVTVQSIDSLLMLAVRPVYLSGWQAAIKRAFDVAVSAVLLVATSPLLALIALAVKLGSRGPVLYRQQRAGRDGRPFTMLKFRTMVDGADSLRAGLTHLNEASGPLFKVRDDPRVTAVGRVLRRHSLDEVPQLFNVLRGDMSLAGPRPARVEEIREYAEWHRARLEVRPGVTGLWQVSGRSDLSFDDYVRFDVFYIENWSVLMDLYILAKTVPAVLSGKGAY